MMKRLIKLAISLTVRGWDIGTASLMRLIGRKPPPMCVVLYYHGVDATQRERFARQMDEVLRLTEPIPADLQEPLNRGRHYCAVTFDDGFVSVIENALPELERRRIPSTIFVPTGSLGKKPAWVKELASRAGREVVMTTTQIAALRKQGLVCVGSHSVSHPNYLELDESHAAREFCESKAELEGLLGEKVALFSFPFGKYSERLVELARKVGYERVFTIEPESGWAHTDRFVTGRVAVDPDNWPIEFYLKLVGTYRWSAESRN
jgi:peptidoglycan/xylan/chitin deacetylase (PgdA/CDA1 family)